MGHPAARTHASTHTHTHTRTHTHKHMYTTNKYMNVNNYKIYGKTNGNKPELIGVNNLPGIGNTRIVYM